MRTWEGGLGIEGDVQDDGQCGMEPQRAYGNLSQRARVLYSRGQPNTCSRGKGLSGIRALICHLYAPASLNREH